MRFKPRARRVNRAISTMDNNETDKNMKVELTARDAFDAGRAAAVQGYESLADFAAAALRLATQSALRAGKVETTTGKGC